MDSTPNTVGLILLLIAVFLGSVLWATRGHTAEADPEEEDIMQVGKTV